MTTVVDCPVCGTRLEFVATDHPADAYYVCPDCKAAWSDGKEPEEDS